MQVNYWLDAFAGEATVHTPSNTAPCSRIIRSTFETPPRRLALGDLKQQGDRERQRAAERVAGKEAEAAEARERERAALHRVSQAEGETQLLRAQLVDAQAVAAERSKLAQELQDLKRHTVQEIHRAAERSAHKDAEAVEASKSERAARDRAARAEGEVSALREQLGQLTVALRDSRADTSGRRG